MGLKIICCVLSCLFFIQSPTLVSWAQARKAVNVPAPESAAQNPPSQPQTPLTQPSKVGESKNVATIATGDNRPLQVGEKLSFNVSWSKFVTAARLEMEVAGAGAFFGQQGYQLKTKVETTGYVRSVFIEVDNQYTSYIDAKTFLPYHTDNLTRQGKRNDDTSVTIDQQRKIARYGDSSELVIPAETFDLTSLVYALRLRDLSAEPKGKKFTALFGRQLVEIEFQVKSRERVTTQAGSYDAIRVDLNAKTKENGDYKVRVWFSDDSKKLPVLIVSKPSFGEVRAELAQISVKPASVNLVSVDNRASEIATTKPIVIEAANIAPSEFETSLPFGVGERLSYDIAWLNLGSIGKLNLAVQQRGSLDNKIVFEMVADVSSVGAAKSIINLNDIIKSYTNVETLVPLKTETIIQEGKRRKQIVATYKDNSVKLDNGTHFNVEPRTLDMVSLFYAIRAAQLTPGTSQPFSFVDANHRFRSLLVKAVKKESINSTLGVRETIQLDIINQPNNQLLAQGWVTNDARRLPLYIVARLSFGEIRCEIKSATNTR